MFYLTDFFSFYSGEIEKRKKVSVEFIFLSKRNKNKTDREKVKVVSVTKSSVNYVVRVQIHFLSEAW